MQGASAEGRWLEWIGQCGGCDICIGYERGKIGMTCNWSGKGK